MFTNIMENRGKEFTTLVKIGDLLGRSLRENIELFSIEQGKVTYVTESNKLIRASYSLESPPKLTNIEVGDANVFTDKDAFSKLSESRVNVFITNLFENDYTKAEIRFDEVLNLWTTRLEFEKVRERLNEKTERFGPQNKIVDSDVFSKLTQIKKDLVKTLKENTKIMNVPEIRNAIKLANIVSNSFNLPKLTYKKLQENKNFSLKNKHTNSLYEHLCRQELINKELKEARVNFENIWASNQSISELAGMIHESDSTKVMEQLAKVIIEVPYFGLASKKQLNNLITNSINLNESESNHKDITDFISRICESKKPVKNYILKLLNEEYGINVSTLTEVPTFSNLIKTERVIFETLSRLMPKGSVIKDVLTEMSEFLKDKNGVESIDLMDFINTVFNDAKYTTSINETGLMQYLDFTRVADDLGKIGSVLKMLQPVLGGSPAMPGAAPSPQPIAPLGGQPTAGVPNVQASPNPLEKEGQYDDAALSPEAGIDSTPMGQMDPQAAAADAQSEFQTDSEAGHLEPDGDEGINGAEGLDIDNPEGGLGGGGMAPAEATVQLPQEQVLNILAQLQAILSQSVGGGESITPEGAVDGQMPVEGEPEAPVEGNPMAPPTEEGGAPLDSSDSDQGETEEDSEPEFEDAESGEPVKKSLSKGKKDKKGK